MNGTTALAELCGIRQLPPAADEKIPSNGIEADLRLRSRFIVLKSMQFDNPESDGSIIA